MEAANADVPFQPEALQNRATRQQAVKGGLRHGGSVQSKVLEAGKVQRQRHLIGEVAAAKLGYAEGGREA